MKVFERFAAFLFLLLLIGMVAFLTFVPVPEQSKQVILMILGGLMTTAATALPKLFGSEDTAKQKMQDRLVRLEIEYEALKGMYDVLTKELIKHHVLADSEMLRPQRRKDHV